MCHQRYRAVIDRPHINMSLSQCPQHTPTATTTTIGSVCPKCGTVGKSGKTSCCGRSGSWFGNCGSFGNTKLDHTWYEDIWVCKTRSQSERANRDVVQRVNSPYGDDTGTAKIFAFTSANTSIPIPARDDNSHADSVLVTITFACVVLLILMTVIVMRFCFFHKNGTVKKDVPVVSS